jgi:urease accessory protein
VRGVAEPGTASEREGIFAGNRARGCIALNGRSDGGCTRPQRVAESGSLRVRFPRSPGGALEAVVVNTAGGIAGGDCFEFDIVAEPGAHLTVSTAAAEKVYRSLGPDAIMRIRLSVAAGGSLAWLPHETILFDRARLKRSIEIELEEDAFLVVAEAIVFGRTGMGEAVKTGRLLDRWRVRCGRSLVFADAVRLEGAIAECLAEPAVAAGGVAIGTLLIAPGTAAIVEAVRTLSAALCGEVGVSAWNGLALARFCAKDGAALRHDLACVLRALHGQLLLRNSLPRLWLN